MNRVLCAVVMAVLLAIPALAQAPAGQLPVAPPSQPVGSQPEGMPGMMGGGMMCPMMGGGMAGMPGMMGGGMGMPGGAQDPKMMGRMLQMRADMMRAMADVLAKHGKALEEGK